MKYKVLGFNDDFCTCMLCGKEELKGTYALENTQTGEIIRAGSTCGAIAAGWTTKELKENLKAAEQENRAKARQEFHTSVEYLTYRSILEQMDKADAELNMLIDKAQGDERQRLIAIKHEQSSPKARWNKIDKAGDKMEIKRQEIQKKYNVKYIN